MEPLDVPEVTQLPELSGGEESPVGFADMVLTSLLVYDAAILYAEHTPTDGADSSVSWRIEPREEGIRTHDIEIASSPSLGSFRSVLARFGHHYLGGASFTTATCCGFSGSVVECIGVISTCRTSDSQDFGFGCIQHERPNHALERTAASSCVFASEFRLGMTRARADHGFGGCRSVLIR